MNAQPSQQLRSLGAYGSGLSATNPETNPNFYSDAGWRRWPDFSTDWRNPSVMDDSSWVGPLYAPRLPVMVSMYPNTSGSTTNLTQRSVFSYVLVPQSIPPTRDYFAFASQADPRWNPNTKTLSWIGEVVPPPDYVTRGYYISPQVSFFRGTGPAVTVNFSRNTIIVLGG